MTTEEITRAVLRELHRIAPDADTENLLPDRDLRDELDLDSMDVLRFVTGLHETLGVNIPESDYRQITSIHACTDYLAKRLA